MKQHFNSMFSLEFVSKIILILEGEANVGQILAKYKDLYV